jgi:hypothetical protein
MCEWQVPRERYFRHEHLASVPSWGLDEVKAVRRMDGVATATGDACMFGAKPVDAEGAERPAKKPTRWRKSTPQLLRSLGLGCDGVRVHTKPLGGHAKAAAKYPPELVLAIIRGLQAQREADARAKGEKSPYSEALVQATSEDRAAWGDKVVLDEYTGDPLDPELVRKGREEELRHFKSKAVW